MKQFALAVLTTAAALAPVAGAQHISVGIVGGVPFTGGLSDVTTDAVHTFSNSKEYIVGPMVEVRLPLSLGIEVDALYRPVNVATDSPSATPRILALPTSNNYSTWEFPVLGKFRLPLLPVIKPFVEAGPSFRAKGSSLSYFSGKGFTFGGGIEAKILRLRIAPVIRYTHWGSDSPGQAIACAGTCVTSSFTLPPSNQNQAEFLVGFSF